MPKVPYVRAQIWEMSPDLSLQNIRTLHQHVYHEPIDYLIDRDDVSYNDSHLLHHWEDISDIQVYTTAEEQPEQIRYYTAKGILEAAVPAWRAFADEEQGTPLQRSMRVTGYQAQVIFFERHERVYAIVFGSSSAFQIRTILMGNGRDYRRRDEWGRISIDVPHYHLESDFFYWLFHHRGEVISTSYFSVEVRDIEGIGRYSERQQHDMRGRGPNLTGELSNKTALGVNQLVYLSAANLSVPGMNIHLSLGEHSDCILDLKRSTLFNAENGAVDGIHGHENAFFLKLYVEIIPGLISAYNRDIQENRWSAIEAANTSRKWTLEVIDELARHHRLTDSEILSLPWFANRN